MFDWRNIPTHTETALNVYFHPMTVGMRPYRKTSYDCRLSPFRELDGKIISIYRYRSLEVEMRRKELAYMLTKDVNRKIEYDFAGLLEFLDERFQDVPQDYYCSEHHTMRLTTFVPELSRFRIRVSPLDLVRFSVGNPDLVVKII